MDTQQKVKRPRLIFQSNQRVQIILMINIMQINVENDNKVYYYVLVQIKIRKKDKQFLYLEGIQIINF